MDIESMAVNAVSDAISKTDLLVPYFNSKDKVPIWDGEIYAYSQKTHDNQCFIGKAPVQIKGKTIKKLGGEEISYPVIISDLQHYRKNGGVLFFVVQIDALKERKIYYAALLPYEIFKILDGNINKKKVAVRMHVFPMRENEVTNIVVNFIRDSSKQYLHQKDTVPSLEDFIKETGIENISFGFTYTDYDYDKKKPYEYLFNNDIYVYAKNNKLNVDFTMNHLWRAETIETTIPGKVRVDGRVFYSSFEVSHKVDYKEIILGKSIIFHMNKDGGFKVDYNLKGNLNQRILDMEFLDAFFRIKIVDINGMIIPINPTTEELERFKVKDMQKHLQYLQRVKKALDFAGVKKPLECENISKKDEEYIRMLIYGLLDDSLITFKEEYVPPLANIKISNLKIMLHFQQMKGGYKVKNLEDMDLECMSDDADGRRFPTSKYTVLMDEDFDTVDNLNFTYILEDIKKYNNQGHLVRANSTLLEMLKAYDRNNNCELLSIAHDLAEWLYHSDGMTDMACINLYQCYFRQRKLNIKEEDKLLEIIENNNSTNQLILAAYILLGDKKMAKRFLGKLEESEAKVFMEYPIYTLMKENFSENRR